MFQYLNAAEPKVCQESETEWKPITNFVLQSFSQAFCVYIQLVREFDC